MGSINAWTATRSIALVAVSALFLLALASCGDDEGGETSASGSGCSDVQLGKIDGQEISITEIPKPDGISCEEAEEVAGEWGRQQVEGSYEAKLPPGWSCSSTCRKGDAQVTFTIAYKG